MAVQCSFYRIRSRQQAVSGLPAGHALFVQSLRGYSRTRPWGNIYLFLVRAIRSFPLHVSQNDDDT